MSKRPVGLRKGRVFRCEDKYWIIVQVLPHGVVDIEPAARQVGAKERRTATWEHAAKCLGLST